MNEDEFREKDVRIKGVEKFSFPSFENEKITLRDQLAKAALQGLCSAPGSVYGWDQIAQQAYLVADCMLEARKK